MKSSKIRRIKLLVLVIFLLAGVEYFVNQTNEDNNKPRSYDLRNLGSKFENLGGLDSYLKSKADIGEQERLLKTLQFALEERDSEDEELVAYVRTLIREPFLDNEKNLTEKHKTDFSQIGQSKYIDELLEGRRDGFYVEAGSLDGESFSNSLFFELERNWNGILIEPNPTMFKEMMKRKRRAYALNACITDKVSVGNFLAFDDNYLSGLDNLMSDKQRRRGNAGQHTFVPCFSLITILKAINVNKVDYFSLDVEGGEVAVLKAIDFTKVDIKSFTIEHNSEYQFLDAIVDVMLRTEMYRETDRDHQDIYFLKSDNKKHPEQKKRRRNNKRNI